MSSRGTASPPAFPGARLPAARPAGRTTSTRAGRAPQGETGRAARRAFGLILLRLPLLALGFALLAAGRLTLGSSPHSGDAATAGDIAAWPTWAAWAAAWRWAADHAYVVVSLAADLPGLWLLRRALRAEGRTLGDLVGFERRRLRRELLLGVGVFALMAVPFGALPPLAEALTGAAPYPAGLTHPPRWVALWTVLVFPLTTAPTEELLFRAYALPRLRGAVGLPLAVLASAAVFGAAHLLLPPVGGAATLLARWLTLTGVGVLLELLYLRLGRLVPLIVGHLLVDALLIGGFAVHAAS